MRRPIWPRLAVARRSPIAPRSPPHRSLALARRLIPALVWVALASTPAFAADPELESLMERGHWKQVRALVEPRARPGSSDAPAISVMSRVELAFGNDRSALDLAERAVALDGASAAYHYHLAEVVGSMAQKAGPFKGLGLARHFKKEDDLAVALDPRNVGARRDLMEFYLQAPGLIGGDKKKARAMADTIARLDPAQGMLAAADLALAEKHEAEAEAVYRKALAARTRDYEVLVSTAGFFGRDSKKQWDIVEACGKDAIEVDPGRSGGYVVLASLYAHLERWSDLDALLARSEQALPENLNPTYQAGRILLADGKDLERAERYFRRYLSQEPEGGAPTLAHAHWRLGLVLEKLGRKSDALAEVETAVRLKPDLDAAKKDLNRLKKR